LSYYLKKSPKISFNRADLVSGIRRARMASRTVRHSDADRKFLHVSRAVRRFNPGRSGNIPTDSGKIIEGDDERGCGASRVYGFLSENCRFCGARKGASPFIGPTAARCVDGRSHVQNWPMSGVSTVRSMAIEGPEDASQ